MMKKLFVLCLGFMLSTTTFAVDINYSNSAELSGSSVRHKLVDAEYLIVPTKTEMRKIPDCTPNAESGNTCLEEVAIESTGVVMANVSYLSSMNPEAEGQEVKWLSFNFKLSDFEGGEIDLLKRAYPRWRNPMSNAPRKFAERNLALSVENKTKTIKVVDMSQSKICRTRQDGTKIPGCVEKLVYKDAQVKYKAITVSLK